MNIFHTLPQTENTTITIGSFDGVHRGHQYLLDCLIKEAKKNSNSSFLVSFEPHPRLVLPRNSDFTILNTLEEKIYKLSETELDNVFFIPFTKELSNLTAEQFIEKYIIKPLNPKTIVVGYDHKFGRDRKGSIDTFLKLKSQYNFEVVQVNEYLYKNQKVNSTAIRKDIQSGNIESANDMLGYHYLTEGIVVEGKKLGRTIGYPTANLLLDNPKKTLPKSGVYATYVEFEGRRYLAATSIGINPTTSDNNNIKIEAFILDFDMDIYGKNLKIEWVNYLREEKNFSSLEDLKKAIEQDVSKVKTILHV